MKLIKQVLFLTMLVIHSIATASTPATSSAAAESSSSAIASGSVGSSYNTSPPRLNIITSAELSYISGELITHFVARRTANRHATSYTAGDDMLLLDQPSRTNPATLLFFGELHTKKQQPSFCQCHPAYSSSSLQSYKNTIKEYLQNICLKYPRINQINTAYNQHTKNLERMTNLTNKAHGKLNAQEKILWDALEAKHHTIIDEMDKTESSFSPEERKQYSNYLLGRGQLYYFQVCQAKDQSRKQEQKIEKLKTDLENLQRRTKNESVALIKQQAQTIKLLKTGLQNSIPEKKVVPKRRNSI